MSRAGATASRLRRLRGIAICPLVADLQARAGHPPLLGAKSVRCAVCDRPVSVAPSTQRMLAEGWAPVCTHDAARFKHVMAYEVEPPDMAAEREQLVETFARMHGVNPATVTQTLPPELEFLHERGLVAEGRPW